MPNNGSQAAPPSGAPDGGHVPLEPAPTPGCLSQYLEEARELIHQCAREADHPGKHSDRLPGEVRGDPWQRSRRVMKSNDCEWWDEHALEATHPDPIPLRFTDEAFTLNAQQIVAIRRIALRAQVPHDPLAFAKITAP